MTAMANEGNDLIDRTVELLGHLVAAPTESRTSNRGLIDWTADRLTAFGASVSIIDGALGGDHGRANLLARVGPERPGGLLLSGHTDVVPAGDGWATPPYVVTAVGDVLAGRGTADMKGFIACVLTMVESLDVASLRRPLHIALSYDEEVGCVGVRSLLHELGESGEHHSVRPELIVIGEPTMMRPCHAHLGKLAYRLVFSGRAGHSSTSPTQPSCISAAARVIAALESTVARLPAADVTANVGTIHGGTALNVLADHCEISFEVRHSVRFDPDDVLGDVWSVVDAEHERLAAVGGGIERVELSRYPALSTDTSDPWVRVVERAADRGPSVTAGYGTEGGLFAAATSAPVMICGPGDIGVAHRADEHVSLEQLRACAAFLPRLVDEVCGSRPSVRSGGE
jgi:acetylornithine deacetylase